MTFLRNTWYVAAWDHEIRAGELFQRKLLNEPILFFRGESGTVFALMDRCAHRFVPLSLGKLHDNQVQCAYHGLAYDGTGHCVYNPHGDGAIPKAARVKTYPVVETYGAIWIWMGDPARADPAMIPDFSCMDAQYWHVGKRYLAVQSNYMLENDNILDLSHIEFLHPTTLGTEAVRRAAGSVKQEGTTIWAYRQTSNEILTDFLYEASGVPHGMPVDRWFDVRWDPPSNMLLFSGAVPCGTSRNENEQTLFPHLFTPETESTTHYWFSVCLPKAMGSIGADLVEKIVDGINWPFTHEDLPMLEAQQRSIGTNNFWDLKPVLLAGDASAVRARRVLDGLIAAELAADGGAHGGKAVSADALSA